MAQSQTVDQLIEFLKTAAARGQLNQNTAISLRSSVERVLGVLDSSEAADVAKIDLDSAALRFRNLNPSVSAQSVEAYKKRIGKAIEFFLAFRNNPSGWKPPAARRSEPYQGPPGKRTAIKRTAIKRTDSRAVARDVDTRPESIPDDGAGERGLTMPFPLRSDWTMVISNIPRDLRTHECERIAAFLKSLASDYSS